MRRLFLCALLFSALLTLHGAQAAMSAKPNIVCIFSDDHLLQGFLSGEHGWFDKRFQLDFSGAENRMVECPMILN